MDSEESSPTPQFKNCAHCAHNSSVLSFLHSPTLTSIHDYWKNHCSVMSKSLWPHGLYSPWIPPGQNTGVDSLSLLQGIFLTQELNPGLPHHRRILYQLNHLMGSPRILKWVAYPFSSRSSWPRNRTRVSCITDDSLPTELSGKPLRSKRHNVFHTFT